MATIDIGNPLAAAVEAIRAGDLSTLQRLLGEYPDLVTARIASDGTSRTLLHVATDWPGHLPNGSAIVVTLIGAGADINARVNGPHAETPLHWAASNDDVEVLDILIDAGADIEADGGIIANGPPLADARAFGQWRAAHRLVARGARTTLTDAATLGLMNRVANYFGADTQPAVDEITRAFWGACHGGQQPAADFLLERGADVNWIPPWENLTPLDAAQRTGADELVAWLRSRGARTADEAG